MYEYEVLQIQRRKEKKVRETERKRGKKISIAVEEYIEVELIADFFTRVKETLNDWGKKGWQVVSANYCLPIQGRAVVASNVPYMVVSHAETDWEEVSYAVVLQRSK